MKRIALFITCLFLTICAAADEGMWLPSLIKEKIGDMQAKGFKLSAEDIYSINQASLKDGIVHFDGGCTGELISDEGLLITNHHCGYGQIQAHSSVEHDYLTEGFWAMYRSEELPNKNLYVRFLIRMEDVTSQVLKGCEEGGTEDERIAKITENSSLIIDKAKTEGIGYKAKVESLYYGNQYFLFVYQEFTDVRLVGAPPSSIGKFGGDTDNWMWPRHTGDFSLFRIYADKDNNPAAYSKENIPYKPKKFFKISLKGVKENDFTLVYGFPGRTQQYILSNEVDYIANHSNPHKIDLRTKILDIYNAEMDKSADIRIRYSAKNASVSNAWKKWQGEAKGIKKMNTVALKREYEEDFIKWSFKYPRYNGLVPQMKAICDSLFDYQMAADYHREAILAIEALDFVRTFRIVKEKQTKEKCEEYVDSYFKDYYLPIDKACFITLISTYQKNISEEFQPEYFRTELIKHASVENWADSLYNTSIYVNKEKLMWASEEELRNDPFAHLYDAFSDYYSKNIYNKIGSLRQELSLLYRRYMQGQIDYNNSLIETAGGKGEQIRTFYPDANSTLRIAYGAVQGYSPADGIYYHPSSSLEGIMQKDNPEIYDYNIPQKLRDLYSTKDYGRWEVNGSVPVCFIATNHTSGGNSGSPVLNADGELIGINFDRVWEGTMSDIVFDPDICRNISLDIRYVLFLIDKLAGANHLIEEMTLVE